MCLGSKHMSGGSKKGMLVLETRAGAGNVIVGRNGILVGSNRS